MPTVRLTESRAVAESWSDPDAIGNPDAIACEVACHSSHDLLPAGWTNPTPFEWSGYQDGARTLLLVSATWTLTDLIRYSHQRWYDLTLRQQVREHSEERKTSARPGGVERGRKTSEAAKELAEDIYALEDKYNALKSHEGKSAVGWIAQRKGLSERTVRRHLKGRKKLGQ